MQKIFEIRREADGTVLCTSSVERCGYTPALIRAIVSAGYGYYVDGKRQGKKKTEEETLW